MREFVQYAFLAPFEEYRYPQPFTLEWHPVALGWFMWTGVVMLAVGITWLRRRHADTDLRLEYP